MSSRTNSSQSSRRSSVGRLHGRITKEDIRAAGLRRWDGRKRMTTDWENIYLEPELYASSGDLLIYLREPGQSSRGPSFRVHKEQLRAKGFHSLLATCVSPPPLPTSQPLPHLEKSRRKQVIPAELYIPAPAFSDLSTTFDHHITTRNFFAWIYNLPLAGRALGHSLVSLHDRINYYRGGHLKEQTKSEVIAFAESQRYLDFRECIDHALAALHLAESLEIEDLWIDAFAHSVGMSHQDISTSLEYPAVSTRTRIQVHKARLDMDIRLDRVSNSIENFFENDLSANLLGFPLAARNHFDRFRSFLHAFYIEQHGFWPPKRFNNSVSRRNIYTSMYSDFRNLYSHLVDLDHSSELGDSNISATGGVCTLQNVKAFDAANQYESLPKPLPRLPIEPDADARIPGKVKRQTWNPVARRKLDRETRCALRVQALIDASNREMSIMECPLVRRFSEFETETVHDTSDNLSFVEGRKVRWIAVYAILQTLISVIQAPRPVRNTEGLSYSLCCHAPKEMPWQARQIKTTIRSDFESQIVPDTVYRASTISAGPLDNGLSRRGSLPSRTNSMGSIQSAVSRTSSLARLMRRQSGHVPSDSNMHSGGTAVPTKEKRNSFCEIMVEGYGNGLNKVLRQDIDEQQPGPQLVSKQTSITGDITKDEKPLDRSVAEEQLSSNSSPSVSRESSNASSTSSRSKGSTDSTVSEPRTPKDEASKRRLSTNLPSTMKAADLHEIANHGSAWTKNTQSLDMLDEFGGPVHINTRTWDEILGL